LHGWQANKKRTCAQPVVLGLCPKLKYHRYGGWIFFLPEPKAQRSAQRMAQAHKTKLFGEIALI